MKRIFKSLGLVLLLIVGGANAQDAMSLEKTYAGLCGTQAAQQGETCVALREAIENKPAARSPLGVAGGTTGTVLDVGSWGLLARLAGTHWIAGPRQDGTITVHKYSLVENGAGVELKAYTPGVPLGLRIVFRKGMQPGLLQSEVYELGDAKKISVPFHADADSLRSDWYRVGTTLGMGGVNLKREVVMTRDGAYVFLQGYGRGSERPAPVDGFPDGFVQYDAGDVATMEARGKIAGEAAMAQAYQDLVREKRQERRERADRFNAAMQSLQGTLAAANEVAAANEARSHAELDATLARAAAQAHASTGAEADAAGQVTGRQYEHGRKMDAQRNATEDEVPGNAGAGSKPLRFVLDIGLLNKPGDTVNPTCYSNVLTRPGPPGWGVGSLPDGSVGKARQTVESLKERFIALCRASGREITSEGNFHWTWNELKDSDQQVDNTHARYPEDVSVNL